MGGAERSLADDQQENWGLQAYNHKELILTDNLNDFLSGFTFRTFQLRQYLDFDHLGPRIEVACTFPTFSSHF